MFKKVGEENLSQEFRLKNIEEVNKYFNRPKFVKVFTVLNYMEHFLVLASAATG